MFSVSKIFCLMPTAVLCLSSIVSAQESAYADLNACVRDEQITMTAKGAGMGALTGLAAGFLSGKKDNAVKGAAIGAVVGGAAGFATAYYSAIGNCYKKNPSWIPESRIERTKNFEVVKKETKYKPSEGIKVEARKIMMASSVKPGSSLDINTSFVVLTPDGAETVIAIERKLYIMTDGNETSLDFPGKTSEERTVEPGEHKDSVKLPISADMKAGTVLRVEFSVAGGNKAPSRVSASVTVN